MKDRLGVNEIKLLNGTSLTKDKTYYAKIENKYLYLGRLKDYETDKAYINDFSLCVDKIEFDKNYRFTIRDYCNMFYVEAPSECFGISCSISGGKKRRRKSRKNKSSRRRRTNRRKTNIMQLLY